MPRNINKLYIVILVVIFSIIILYAISEYKFCKIDFYTPRRVDITEKHGIPLILHEFWHSSRIPYNMSNVVKNHIEMNPEFDVYVYSEKEAISFIKEHFDKDVIEAYYGFKPSAYRSDLFRYCVLYIKGGVYVDTKMQFFVPFTQLIKDSKPLLLKTHVKWCGDGRGVQNNFIIAPPKWDILRMMIEEIVIAHKKKLYKQNELDITGPCLIGDILQKTNQMTLRDNSPCISSEEDASFVIRCDNTIVSRSYRQYRDEQAISEKEPRYKILWEKHDVYW